MRERPRSRGGMGMPSLANGSGIAIARGGPPLFRAPIERQQIDQIQYENDNQKRYEYADQHEFPLEP